METRFCKCEFLCTLRLTFSLLVSEGKKPWNLQLAEAPDFLVFNSALRKVKSEKFVEHLNVFWNRLSNLVYNETMEWPNQDFTFVGLI